MKEIEDKIIVLLNNAKRNLDKKEFSQLSKSIIDYIDEINFQYFLKEKNQNKK